MGKSHTLAVMHTSDALSTPGEIADRLGVSTETVRRYAESGRIPTAALLPSGHRRFRWADVLAALGDGVDTVEVES